MLTATVFHVIKFDHALLDICVFACFCSDVYPLKINRWLRISHKLCTLIDHYKEFSWKVYLLLAFVPWKIIPDLHLHKVPYHIHCKYILLIFLWCLWHPAVQSLILISAHIRLRKNIRPSLKIQCKIIFRGKYSTFCLCMHCIPIYSLYTWWSSFDTIYNYTLVWYRVSNN